MSEATLDGVVERVTFHNEENGYCVLRVSVKGLADTVTPVDPRTGEGTGVLFDHFTPEGLDWAIRAGLRLYRNRRLWRQVQRNGMAEDFGWDRRVGEYEILYRTLAGVGQEV